MRLLLATLTAVVLAASPASAAVRSGSVDDPMDAQDTTPSLNPRPVTSDITHVQVSYDEAGTVTLQVSFAGDSSQSPMLDFQLACTGSPALAGRLSRQRSYSGNSSDYWNDVGTIELDGYDGSVDSRLTASQDSHTLQATFTHGAFANRSYRCVRGQWDNASVGANFADDFHLWFSGFEPQRLTTTSAGQAADAALRAAYGSRWTKSRPHYVRCAEFTPAEDPFADPDYGLSAEERKRTANNPAGATGLCTFQFGNGSTITGGGLAVTADDQTRTIAVKRYPGYRWKRAWHKCRKAGLVLRANEPCGGLSLLGDDISGMAGARFPRKLPTRFNVVSHGTNTEGFDAVYVYRCRSRSRVVYSRAVQHPVMVVGVACTNALGDSFTVHFSMA